MIYLREQQEIKLIIIRSIPVPLPTGLRIAHKGLLLLWSWGLLVTMVGSADTDAAADVVNKGATKKQTKNKNDWF